MVKVLRDTIHNPIGGSISIMASEKDYIAKTVLVLKDHSKIRGRLTGFLKAKSEHHLSRTNGLIQAIILT